MVNKTFNDHPTFKRLEPDRVLARPRSAGGASGGCSNRDLSGHGWSRVIHS